MEPTSERDALDRLERHLAGRYTIVREIGRGGMARVLLATDIRHHRRVAIKLLRPELLGLLGAERFLSEIRVTASLQHPNILALYDSGEADGLLYYVMPFVEGESLRARLNREGMLPVDEVLAIIRALAAALDFAHRNGIIHRDIKPENILLQDGQPVLADFGIALAISRASDERFTQTGLSVGTPQYMSPEQATAEREIGPGSDIYSLGAVAYEMLAGEPPISGTTREAMLARTVLEPPRPIRGARPTVPAQAETAILKALAKHPADRHRTAAQFASALETADRPLPSSRPRRLTSGRRVRVGAVAIGVLGLMAAGLLSTRSPTLSEVAPAMPVTPVVAEAEPSIVVLPFLNLSPDRENEYFSDGLTEEIITGLASVPGLKVISRTSAMHYKGSTKALPQIASELGVDHILEGSVRKSGGRVRISAQLIDSRTDEHLWAENYDHELRDIFGVQQEIAQAVAGALEIELGERTRRLLVRQGTRDPQAYDLYRRGRFLWNLRTPEGHDQALAYFQQAIARDSAYADAYAGIADLHLTAWQNNLSGESEAEAYANLKRAAERALALDDESADAHTSVAVALWWQKDWPGAERELRRALELNPGHATVRSWYSLLLQGMGRPAEALRESLRAYELDPFAVINPNNVGFHCHVSRDYNCAIEYYGKVLEISPLPAAYSALGLVHAAQGDTAEALRALRKALELAPHRGDLEADFAYGQAMLGLTKEARETLRSAKRQPLEPFRIARAHVQLGEADSAFAWLGHSNWQWPHRALLSDPALDPIRSDARFAAMAARVKREMGLR